MLFMNDYDADPVWDLASEGMVSLDELPVRNDFGSESVPGPASGASGNSPTRRVPAPTASRSMRSGGACGKSSGQLCVMPPRSATCPLRAQPDTSGDGPGGLWHLQDFPENVLRL
jgi:hypothetical protein